MKISSQAKKGGQILYQTVLRAPLNNEEFREGQMPVRIMPYNQATISTKTLAETIAKRCTVKEPDINGVLTALAQVLRETLLDGDRLKVDGIGTFGLSLTLKKTDANGQKRQPKALYDRIVSSDVCVGRIVFTPDAELRTAMKNAEFVSSGVRADRPLEREEIDEFLTDHFESQNWLTRHELEAYFDISRTQAIQWLRALVADGSLRPAGVRNSRFYIPAPGHFGR